MHIPRSRYGSEFWKLDGDGTGPANEGKDCMTSMERMLRLVVEDRRERNYFQTNTVHALIKKTATVDGAIQSFISKYGDRRRLLRCAQHILHGSSISTTGAMQTVLISAVLALVVFTGFFHFVISPGWLSATIICDQEARGGAENHIVWTSQQNVTDRWHCAQQCQSIARINKFTRTQHALFRYSAQCQCAQAHDELDQMFNLYPQCFDDVFLDAGNLTCSRASNAVSGGIMRADASMSGSYDVTREARVSQLLHAKLVILRYWDVQLCRYVLQVSVPASFVVICVMRIFAGLPPLRTVKSM